MATMTIERISPHEARRHMDSQPRALLVCAYDDRRKWLRNRLEESMPLDDFESRADSLDKDRELIFYCA